MRCLTNFSYFFRKFGKEYTGHSNSVLSFPSNFACPPCFLMYVHIYIWTGYTKSIMTEKQASTSSSIDSICVIYSPYLSSLKLCRQCSCFHFINRRSPRPKSFEPKQKGGSSTREHLISHNCACTRF